MQTGSSPTIRTRSTGADGLGPHGRSPDIGADYAVRRYIGSGQMAEVYEATHVPSGTPVAIKLLRPELCIDATACARFHREVEAVARLEAPQSVRFYDFGETDAGQLYIVMELMRGEDLRERMNQRGRFNAHEVLGIVKQVAAALADAHSAGVVHRDLKPENIQFVAPDSNRLKVLDFGLAKLQDTAVNGRLTAKMTTVGTPAYIAPELAAARRCVDWRADLYSLAVLTYELLADARPFHGVTPMDMMIAHVREPIPSIRTLRPDLPRSIDVFFKTALAKAPQARISSAELFVKALTNALYPH